MSCRYDDGDGNAYRELTKTVASSSPPARTYCSSTIRASRVVGTDGDMFGKALTFQDGETAHRAVGQRSDRRPPTFFLRDVTRDAATGWVTVFARRRGPRDVLRLRRPRAGHADRAAFRRGAEDDVVCYDSPTATTAYRASAAQACPVASSNPNVTTWEHYDYDGLGRTRARAAAPARRRRSRSGSRSIDGAGHAYFQSEWVPNATGEAVNSDVSTTCLFAGGNVATARPSAAPGTYRLCCDPFGRPQEVVGAKHSSLATIDAFGRRQSRTATRGNRSPGTASTRPSRRSWGPPARRARSTRSPATRRDAFGRITSVTRAHRREHDLRLRRQRQGRRPSRRAPRRGPSRSTRRVSCAPRRRPKRGRSSTASIGSLGNVRQETRPGGVVVTRTFDFAGRLTEEDAGGLKYLVNCYDGKATCVDGSAGFGGGAYPAGKLTRRYGLQPDPHDRARRRRAVRVRGRRRTALEARHERGQRRPRALGEPDVRPTATSVLVTNHGHPRSTGAFPVVSTYTNGLPTALSGNGAAVVTAAAYNPAAGLASWTAGTSGAPVVTSIAQDATMLPRPASISNSLWSTGTYVYDGAGNVLKMGTGDTFTYDSRSRLASAKYGSSQRSFGYDRYGNLTQNGATITIDPVHNRVTSGSASYDARGDLTYYAGDTMSYDALDRQYRNSNGSGDWVSLYNGAGERIIKFPAKFTVLRREMARYVAEANVVGEGLGPAGLRPGLQRRPVLGPRRAAHQPRLRQGHHGRLQRGHPHVLPRRPAQPRPDGRLPRQGLQARRLHAAGLPGNVHRRVLFGRLCSTFAPWIEQLYRDGVTGGCSASPLQFCPGNTVGEWEMLVWLAKAPGATPGDAVLERVPPGPAGLDLYFARRPESHRDGNGGRLQRLLHGHPVGDPGQRVPRQPARRLLRRLSCRLAVHRLRSSRQPARRVQPVGPARREPQALALRRGHRRRRRPASTSRTRSWRRTTARRGTTTTRGRTTTGWGGS